MQKKNKNFTHKIDKVRLSRNVIPKEYEIELKPDLYNFTFEGIETVRIGEVFGKVSYDEKAETATFTFPKSFPQGKKKLTLVFKGILNDKMRGFYRSKYTIADKEHHLATTQFEATDARRAFPCFDEPAQKAVFHVSL